MWAKIAEEMAIPWRAAEAMHWQMGEHDMARRAGVTPFTLTNSSTNHTAMSRMNSRSGPAPRSICEPNTRPGSQQLPSLAELTAGMPAYAQPSVYPFSEPNRTPGTPYPPTLPFPRQSLTPPPSNLQSDYFLRRT